MFSLNCSLNYLFKALRRKNIISHTFRYTMTSLSSDKNLVWVDLELTGLDVEKEHILEIACLVTDSQLKIIAEGPNLVIHQSDDVLESMGEWCTEQHGKTGLTAAVRASKISVLQAEQQVLDFVRQYTPPQQCALAGNTVHEDKKFLVKYMPELTRHLHYRIVDVSTVKELCRRWYPDIFSKKPSKKLTHRAMDDIKESVQELQYYRQSIFMSNKE